MKIKHLILSLGILGLVAAVTGCKDDDKTMKGIALNMSSLKLDADAIEQVRFYPVPWDAPLTGSFTWKSENTSVVKVNNKGQVLGVNPGTTNITCECMGFTTTIPVTVNPLVSLPEKIKALNAKGFWEFNATAPTKASIGKDLVFVEDQAKITSIAGPRSDDGAVRVPWDPKKRAGNTTGTFIKCLHGMAAKGGAKVNEYTIMCDLRLPADVSPESGYYTLFSARTLDNSDDQDIAIKTSGAFGIGPLGYCDAGTLQKGKWYRVVIAFNAGKSVVYYCDGAKVKDANVSAAPIDGRFSLLTGGVLFFSDDDGDDSTIDACSIAIWDRQLTTDEVRTLGTVRQTPVFEE